MTATAALRTIERAWSALKPLDLPAAFLGGLALSAWWRPRATRDVELLVAMDGHPPGELLSRFKATGFRAMRDPPVRALGSMQFLQLEYDSPDTIAPIPIDVLIAGSEYHRVALNRRVPLLLSDDAFEVMIVACEDLIIHRLLAGRVIDRVDAAALTRANREALDVPYLNEWSRELALQSSLREVRHEACPDEQP